MYHVSCIQCQSVPHRSLLRSSLQKLSFVTVESSLSEYWRENLERKLGDRPRAGHKASNHSLRHVTEKSGSVTCTAPNESADSLQLALMGQNFMEMDGKAFHSHAT